MSKIPVVSQKGEKVSEAAYAPAKLGSARVVAQAIVTALANRRVVSAHTKTRDEVRGGGKKPWKQKGTGRARHGSIRSPLWVGGGVTFGPRNTRNFKMSMNKAQRSLAHATILSKAVEKESVTIVQEMPVFSGKSKQIREFLTSIAEARSYLIILDAEYNGTNEATLLHQGARNLAGVQIVDATRVSAHDLSRSGHIIITNTAFASLNS